MMKKLLASITQKMEMRLKKGRKIQLGEGMAKRMMKTRVL